MASNVKYPFPCNSWRIAWASKFSDVLFWPQGQNNLSIGRGEVAVLRWSDVTNSDGQIKDEIRLLPDMTKGRHARTVFINARLKAVLQTYADQARCVERGFPFFASQKSVKSGFSANSMAQTFALLYRAAGVEGASSHSGRRSFLTRLANQGTAIHLLKVLAGHRSISTTAAYLYTNPSQLRAVVELV